MIIYAVAILSVLIIFESFVFASLNKKGWRAWPEISMHLIAGIGAGWCLFHIYATDSGHLWLMLAIIAGYMRVWIYRFGKERRAV